MRYLTTNTLAALASLLTIIRAAPVPAPAPEPVPNGGIGMCQPCDALVTAIRIPNPAVATVVDARNACALNWHNAGCTACPGLESAAATIAAISAAYNLCFQGDVTIDAAANGGGCTGGGCNGGGNTIAASGGGGGNLAASGGGGGNPAASDMATANSNTPNSNTASNVGVCSTGNCVSGARTGHYSSGGGCSYGTCWSWDS